MTRAELIETLTAAQAKADKAQQLGVKILSEEEWLEQGPPQ